MRLDYALTATDMRMHENDVILGIPKSSYGNCRNPNKFFFWNLLWVTNTHYTSAGFRIANTISVTAQ